MDTAQIAQMVNWLDEEHRRDRAEIARLQQRLEAQSSDIVEQARRIQELEARLAGTQAHLTKFGQIEHAIQNTKLEVTALVEQTRGSKTTTRHSENSHPASFDQIHIPNHLILKVESVSRAKSTPTIQKRITTFDSCIPPTSK